MEKHIFPIDKCGEFFSEYFHAHIAAVESINFHWVFDDS